MNANVATAIAAITVSIDDALVAGRPTVELRRELAELERQQRAEAAKATAEEHALRAAAEAEEEERQRVAAEALAAEVQARIEATLAALALPAPLAARRYPNGSVETVQINTEE